MIKGVTKQGFRFKIEDEVADDWELLELLSTMEDNDYLSIVKFAKKLLGTSQYEQLKRFCKDKKTGRVSAIKLQEILFEIFSTKDVKN